jgi:hypothetical protein
MGKNYYIQKISTLLKLLPNAVIARNEALISANKVLYACVNDVCRLRAQPRFNTIRLLLIIAEAL